jgi:hypothetical protein
MFAKRSQRRLNEDVDKEEDDDDAKGGGGGGRAK